MLSNRSVVSAISIGCGDPICITIIFMFRFLDDDTDMYNTPYTYNAGRLVSLLAMNTLCLAMRGRTSHFFFLTTLSARFQFL